MEFERGACHRYPLIIIPLGWTGWGCRSLIVIVKVKASSKQHSVESDVKEICQQRLKGSLEQSRENRTWLPPRDQRTTGLNVCLPAGNPSSRTPSPKNNLTSDPSCNGVTADRLFSERRWSTEPMDQLDESMPFFLNTTSENPILWLYISKWRIEHTHPG